MPDRGTYASPVILASIGQGGYSNLLDHKELGEPGSSEEGLEASQCLTSVTEQIQKIQTSAALQQGEVTRFVGSITVSPTWGMYFLDAGIFGTNGHSLGNQ